MLTLDLAPTEFAPTSLAPTPAEVAARLDPAFVLVPLHRGMWRVTRAGGEVLGYIEELDSADGTRYRAKRISARLRRFIALGEFWRMDDAVACFVSG
jgi:hypothetical protein